MIEILQQLDFAGRLGLLVARLGRREEWLDLGDIRHELAHVVRNHKGTALCPSQLSSGFFDMAIERELHETDCQNPEGS